MKKRSAEVLEENEEVDSFQVPISPVDEVAVVQQQGIYNRLKLYYLVVVFS